LATARRQLSPAALDREIDRFESDFRASVRRLQDLVRCCQSESAMRDIAQSARDVQLMVLETAPQLHARNNLVGWRLRLKKP
jgi:hypothetical protein